MLSVNNTTTWTNYFKQLMLKNCNVKIYANDGTLLIDKANISSFKLTSRASYICEQVPSDDCYIEILNWSSLSGTVKTYLSAQNNIIKVAYVVEGDETTNCKVLLTDTCDVDRKGWGAKLHFKSVLAYYTMIPNGVDFGGFFSAFVGAFSVEGTYPLGVTFAEILQNYAIYDVSGLYIYNLTKNTSKDLSIDQMWSFEIVPTNPTLDGSLGYQNVYDDWKITNEDSRSDLQVVGVETGTVTTLHTDTKTQTEGANSSVYTYERETIIDNVEVTVQGSSVAHTELQFFGAIWSFVPTPISYVPTIYKYNGYYAELSTIPLNTKNYIQTYTVMTGSSKANEIQTKARNYFANNRIIDFKGRIDPRFQPLDYIYVDGDISSYMFLEEVTIEFNGGFTGRIVGRIDDN